jgi:predicted transcriptional regulator of viral defense system
MKRSISFQKLGELLKEPFFTSKEAKKCGVSSALLCYYVVTGRIKRLSRGRYQSVSYQEVVANFQWQDLIDAVHAIPGGVVCLISALAVYDLTEEIPRQHWIGVSHGTSIKREKNIKIVRFRNIELGRTFIDLNGVPISIFDRERTIVDAFRFLSYETAIKALKRAVSFNTSTSQRIDFIKLQKYAKKLRIDINPYLMTVMT